MENSFECPKTYLQYNTPESITCLLDSELTALALKLTVECEFYDVTDYDKNRYTKLVGFIKFVVEMRERIFGDVDSLTPELYPAFNVLFSEK